MGITKLLLALLLLGLECIVVSMAMPVFGKSFRVSHGPGCIGVVEGPYLRGTKMGGAGGFGGDSHNHLVHIGSACPPTNLQEGLQLSASQG